MNNLLLNGTESSRGGVESLTQRIEMKEKANHCRLRIPAHGDGNRLIAEP
jgi:hypothetical protein